jgi:hypothetical protein
MFVAMAALLWAFHPGFRISAQPLVIFMAFVILLLSTLVIILLLHKFKAGLDEIRRGATAESSGAQTGRAGVLASAFWLGIANMRKRLLRTLLTAATIVIITFALMCFTSSSTYRDRRVFVLPPAVQPSHDGVLVQHPAHRDLGARVEDNIRTLVGEAPLVAGRYWLTSNDVAWRLHLRNPATNTMVPLKAALGLAPGESAFSRPQEVLGQWDRFAAGEGCYLSHATATRLGVAAGGTVLLGGHPFTVLETFAAIDLERHLRNLDGRSLLPLDFTVERDRADLHQENLEQQMLAAGIMAADPNVRCVSGDEVVIVPAAHLRQHHGSLRSVAVALPAAEVAAMAETLAAALVYPIYFSDGGRVKALVATPLMPKAPRQLLIPLLIAALIIFGTMLNSVAERKKEIHIYTSLGLAPGHVGMLFLAEAATYGLMGTVFGYVVGQGFAALLGRLDLMGGIVLNYSGTSVILTMGLVLLVVMLSALVPAWMAAKVASPSHDADWKVPLPEDGAIRDLLPFTVTVQAARGLACFIHEYLDAHRDGAIGRFTADDLAFHAPTDAILVGISGTAWLAPYDLGVRQSFRIDILRDAEENCRIRIVLRHQAGQERSWWRLNRVFLGELRRQLLGWRKIKPEQTLAYMARGEAAVAAVAAGRG